MAHVGPVCSRVLTGKHRWGLVKIIGVNKASKERVTHVERGSKLEGRKGERGEGARCLATCGTAYAAVELAALASRGFWNTSICMGVKIPSMPPSITAAA